MENYIFYYILTIFVLDFFIVVDANTNDFSAFGWGIGCFFLPFLFVPLYFIYRTHIKNNEEKVIANNKTLNEEIKTIE